MPTPNPEKRARDLRSGDTIILFGQALRVESIDAYDEPFAPGGKAVIVRTVDGRNLPGTWDTLYTLPLPAAA